MLKLYQRLTALVEKLPGGLQKPILRELVPIRELFLEQRPARILVLGGAERMTVPAFLDLLGDVEVETGDSRDGWRTYRVAERGAVEILDARETAPEEFVTAALAASAPDAVVILHGVDEEFSESTARRLGQCEAAAQGGPGVTAVVFGGESVLARARVSAWAAARREFSQRPMTVVAEADGGAVIAETVCASLPNSARLEFARMTGARRAQAAIATTLLKSFTAVCGVIGVQPIPLADMPVLMTLQSLMVGLVVYVSGRRASPRLIAEFAGALGINVGAGFAFREGARALLKIFPFWGNAISGIVAGAGTYAIGRAAVAYFIEGTPLQETKKLFRRLQPGIESFRKRRLSLPHWGKKPKD